MLKQVKRERGIGLLELMLSLSIIAILLVMATRYFMAANESQKINNAISQINGIAGGAANYDLVNPGYANMTIANLIAGRYIPSSLGGSGGGVGANPWGGDIQIALNAPGFSVTLTDVPSVGNPTVCDKLAHIIESAQDTSTKRFATCTGTAVKVDFY